jgi:hypothetical protein
VRFVRYWGLAKDSGIPARIIDVNNSETVGKVPKLKHLKILL